MSTHANSSNFFSLTELPMRNNACKDGTNSQMAALKGVFRLES